MVLGLVRPQLTEFTAPQLPLRDIDLEIGGAAVQNGPLLAEPDSSWSQGGGLHVALR